MGESGEAARAALERRGVEVVTADRVDGTDEDLGRLDGVGLLVKSPGVPGENTVVVEARRRGIPVWAEAELGYRLLPRVRLIGITGTKGKTTTVRLLGAMFDAAGWPVTLAGNEHPPLSAIADDVEPHSWVIAELTSFQLEDVHELSCEVAVLLNVEPDHLDRHDTLEAYRALKLRIFERVVGTAIVPRDSGLPGFEFGIDDPLPAEPRIRGEHNRLNAAAATLVGRTVGLPDEAIARALVSFPGVEHRLEPVAEIDGVTYVNDSKGTNVVATLRALAAYEDEPVRLIAGGRGKGQDFTNLGSGLGPNVRAVYLIGEASDEIAAVAGDRAVPVGDLATAVARAAADADPGDVVLLSPACASFDQFENFAARGEEFKRLVQNLEA
jgi:UDP-N-acetylmuramoylalanine--D-glutamate ligase